MNLRVVKAECTTSKTVNGGLEIAKTDVGHLPVNNWHAQRQACATLPDMCEAGLITQLLLCCQPAGLRHKPESNDLQHNTTSNTLMSAVSTPRLRHVWLLTAWPTGCDSVELG